MDTKPMELLRYAINALYLWHENHKGNADKRGKWCLAYIKEHTSSANDHDVLAALQMAEAVEELCVSVVKRAGQ